MPRIRFGLSVLALLLSSCAMLRSDTMVCSEYRDLVCVGPPRCVPDQARGCRVCQCQNL
jgi:hypothetical protein